MSARNLIFGALMAATVAQASETMRCGKWLVDAETSVPELIAKCGEPAGKESKTEEVRSRRLNGSGTFVVGTSTTERWTYDRGNRAFRMVVTIVDGKVRSIDKAE